MKLLQDLRPADLECAYSGKLGDCGYEGGVWTKNPSEMARILKCIQEADNIEGRRNCYSAQIDRRLYIVYQRLR